MTGTPIPHVWQLGAAECEPAGVLLTRAFVDDAFFRYAIPDLADRARQLPPFFATCLRYGCLFGRVIAAGREQGRAEGVAWWFEHPEADFTPERTRAAGFDPIAELLGPAVSRIAEVAREADAVIANAVPGRRCQLDQIGVDPASQRAGLGSALVQAVVRDAGSAGLPVTLWTANPANLPFYRRLGFEMLGEGATGVEPVHWWAMWLPAP